VERRGERLLMVPVIKGAQSMNFREFVDAYGDVVDRTMANKLTVDDFQGALVSLTNPGTIGTVLSVPRLMSGQSVIVGVGKLAYPTAYQGADPETIANPGHLQGADPHLHLRPPGDPGSRIRLVPQNRRATASGR
jgi:2-oxoglutarate decarboxylase